MKKTILPILVMMLLPGVILAKNLTAGYEPAGLDELAKQKGIFKTTLINPEADFPRYTEFRLRQIVVVVKNPGAQALDNSTGRLLGGRERASVIPEYDEVVEFKRIVGEVIAAKLVQSTALEPSVDTGPNTLVLQPVITDVVFTSSSKNKSEDGRELPTLSQGTIVFDLIDGETGLIVARLGERLKCKPPKGTKSTSGAWPNLAYWTECAATDLARELERVQVGGSQNQSS